MSVCMPVKSLRLIAAELIILAAFVAVLFLPGHVVVYWNETPREFSLRSIAFVGIFAALLLLQAHILWRWLWELPEVIRSYWRKQAIARIERATENDILQMSLLPESNALPEKALDSKEGRLVALLHTALASQYRPPKTLLAAAQHLLRHEATQLAGKLYSAAALDALGRHAEALDQWLSLAHTESCAKLAAPLQARIFLCLMESAQKGDFCAKNPTFLTAAEEELCNPQRSLVLSAQAAAVSARGGAAAIIDALQKTAFEADESNPYAATHAATKTTPDEAEEILLHAIKAYPRWDLCEAFLSTNSSTSTAEKVKKLHKTLSKHHANALETLYCIARSFLKIGMVGEALHYADTLIERFTGAPNQQALQLRAEINRVKNSTSIDWHEVLSADKNQYRCSVCNTVHSHWAAHCSACGATRSLCWVVPCAC